MNTEHDEQLSSLYKQARQEMPPAHLDEAILAAARRETTSKPRPAFSPFPADWRMPAALAAVLVLSFGIVRLMDNEPVLTDGIESFSMDKAEMLQAPGEMAATDSMAEEKRPPARPVMKSRTEADRLDSKQPETIQHQAGRLAMQVPSVATADADMPARIERQGLLSKQELDQTLAEQVGRRQKPATTTTDQVAAASATPLSEAVPTVDVITALRLAGNLGQARLAADAYLRHHFGDELDKVDPAEVKLTLAEWKKFIAELKALGREQQAEKLQGLLSSR